MNLINAIGFFTFIICSGASIIMSFRSYTLLASDTFSWIIMIAVSIIQDGLKTVTLIKGNLLKDKGILSNDKNLRQKARKLYFVYGITLIASILTSFGSTIQIAHDKDKETGTVSYALEIKADNDKLQLKQEQVKLKEGSKAALMSDKEKLDSDRVTLRDAYQRRIDNFTNEILILNDEISKIKDGISNYQIKEREENKNRNKNMYQLISELVNVPTLWIYIIGLVFISFFIEAGIYFLSPHSKEYEEFLLHEKSRLGIPRKEKEKIPFKNPFLKLINSIKDKLPKQKEDNDFVKYDIKVTNPHEEKNEFKDVDKLDTIPSISTAKYIKNDIELNTHFNSKQMTTGQVLENLYEDIKKDENYLDNVSIEEQGVTKPEPETKEVPKKKHRPELEPESALSIFSPMEQAHDYLDDEQNKYGDKQKVLKKRP